MLLECGARSRRKGVRDDRGGMAGEPGSGFGPGGPSGAKNRPTPIRASSVLAISKQQGGNLPPPSLLVVAGSPDPATRPTEGLLLASEETSVEVVARSGDRATTVSLICFGDLKTASWKLAATFTPPLRSLLHCGWSWRRLSRARSRCGGCGRSHRPGRHWRPCRGSCRRGR